MKDIISCSRRTDIPAFYYDWLQEGLKNKKVDLINPYNQSKYTIDLSPEKVHSIVLWSKNYQCLLDDPGLLSEYNLYFQFTINGYSKYLEPNVIKIEQAINQMKRLSEKYSPDQINWRFDPIIFSEDGEVEKTDPCEEARFNMFSKLCDVFSSFNVRRCTISYVQVYDKVKERFVKNHFQYKEITDSEKIEYTQRLVSIASKVGVQIYSCAEPLIEHVEGLNKGHCIDSDVLDSLFGENSSKSKDVGQRKACGCTKSKDIGDYSKSCSHKCLYCYARIS